MIDSSVVVKFLRLRASPFGTFTQTMSRISRQSSTIQLPSSEPVNISPPKFAPLHESPKLRNGTFHLTEPVTPMDLPSDSSAIPMPTSRPFETLYKRSTKNFQTLFEKCTTTLSSLQSIKSLHSIERRDSLLKVRDLEKFNILLKDNLTKIYMAMTELTTENEQLRSLVDKLQKRQLALDTEYLSIKKYATKKCERLEQKLRNKQDVEQKREEMLTMLLDKCIRNEVPLEKYYALRQQCVALYDWGHFDDVKIGKVSASEMSQRDLHSVHLGVLGNTKDIQDVRKKIQDDRDCIVTLLEKFNYEQNDVEQHGILRRGSVTVAEQMTDSAFSAAEKSQSKLANERNVIVHLDPTSTEDRRRIQQSDELQILLGKDFKETTDEFHLVQTYLDKLGADVVMENDCRDQSLERLAIHLRSIMPVVARHHEDFRYLFPNLKRDARQLSISAFELRDYVRNFSTTMKDSFNMWKSQAAVITEKIEAQMRGMRVSFANVSVHTQTKLPAKDKKKEPRFKSRNSDEFTHKGIQTQSDPPLAQPSHRPALKRVDSSVDEFDDGTYIPSNNLPRFVHVQKRQFKKKIFNVPHPAHPRTGKRLCECEICVNFKLRPHSSSGGHHHHHGALRSQPYLDASEWMNVPKTSRSRGRATYHFPV